MIIRYIDVDFGLLDFVHHDGDFVIPEFVLSRFCSLHFTVTLIGSKNIICFSKNLLVY